MTASAYAWPRFSSPADREATEARAREDAAERGYAEGRARAEAEVRAEREALARGLADLTRQIESLGAAQAGAVTELAFAVTRKLLVAELRTNPAVLQTLVEQALETLEAGIEHVQVLVNPADREPLTAALGREQSHGPSLNLKADPSVPTGGVSVSLGARSVEFDPLGRLESFVEQEMSDGAAGGSPGDPDPAV